MKGQIGMIGLEPHELECVRSLVRVLRHPDPVVAELARQALAYLDNVASKSSGKPPPDRAAYFSASHARNIPSGSTSSQ